MWSEARASGPVRPSATRLLLEELVAIQPRYLRGPHAMGARMPLGERMGRGRAQSLDFDGVSPYAPGDDIRWIDWRATARTGEPQVKRFLAQSHRGRLIVPDLRSALFFGTQGRLMAKTAVLAAARLAWESHALNEPVALAVPGQALIVPRRGRRHILRVLDGFLAAYDAHADFDDEALCRCILDHAEEMGRGDEVCVISDFGTSVAMLTEATRALTELRVLRAFVVEDAIGSAPLPRGTYPASVASKAERRVFNISERGGNSLPEQALQARAERRRALLDCGWEVASVADLLPRADAS